MGPAIHGLLRVHFRYDALHLDIRCRIVAGQRGLNRIHPRGRPGATHTLRENLVVAALDDLQLVTIEQDDVLVANTGQVQAPEDFEDRLRLTDRARVPDRTDLN